MTMTEMKTDKCEIRFVVRQGSHYYTIKSSAGRCVKLDSPIDNLCGIPENLKREIFEMVDYVRLGHKEPHEFNEILLSYDVMNELKKLSTWRIKKKNDNVISTWVPK